MNEVSNLLPDGDRILGSYNATGPPTITTKTAIPGSDCVINPRPVNSTIGVLALRDQRAAAAPPNPVRRPCLDWARSTDNTSQDPQFAATGLTYVPFAQDPISYVTRRDSLIPATLTAAQLRAIYLCTAAGTISNPPTILPKLPRRPSGIRADFLRFLNLRERDALPPPNDQIGTCVTDDDPTMPTNPVGLPENTGNRLTDPRHIAPHGAARFFLQGDRQLTPEIGAAEIRRIGGVAPISGGFPFQREVYNVVPTRNVNDPLYSGQFGTTGIICLSPLVIQNFRLFPIARCGVVDPALQTPGGLGPDPGPPAE